MATKYPDPFTPMLENEMFIKAFLWGFQGTGKTVWALRSHKCAYISLEGGAEHYRRLGPNISYPKNTKELGAALMFLKLNNNGLYKTLALDCMSVAWTMFQDETPLIEVKGALTQDWITIKRKWKSFITLLLSLQMDVIAIARSKEASTPGKWYEKTGQLIPDCEKNSVYDFDFELFAYTEENKDSGDMDFKIALNKVRDLSGKIKTGMVLTNTTFAAFKAKVKQVAEPEKPKFPPVEEFKKTLLSCDSKDAVESLETEYQYYASKYPPEDQQIIAKIFADSKYKFNGGQPNA